MPHFDRVERSTRMEAFWQARDVEWSLSSLSDHPRQGKQLGKCCTRYASLTRGQNRLYDTIRNVRRK